MIRQICLLAATLAAASCGEPDCLPAEPGLGGYSSDVFLGEEAEPGLASRCAEAGCLGRETALCIADREGFHSGLDGVKAQLSDVRGILTWELWNVRERSDVDGVFGEGLSLDAISGDVVEAGGLWGMIP